MNFSRFFRAPQQLDDEAKSRNAIDELLNFGATSYYPKLLAWLEKEAASPLKVGNHLDMIQSAVRANTLREVRDTLVKRVEHARAAASAEGEDDA